MTFPVFHPKSYLQLGSQQVPKPLLVVNASLAILYFIVIAFWFERGNVWLYSLLIAGEIFHIWQILTYLITIWDVKRRPMVRANSFPPVDIFITVCGEPVEVVRQTVQAAKNQNYPDYGVFILNDGYVAHQDNWEDIQRLATDMGVTCITRQVVGGAKAGNINHALQQSDRPYVAVFDADMVPETDFLSTMVAYIDDPKVAFVQSPQYYHNYPENEVTGGAWEQQELFFGPICEGKNRLNSTFMCGTNMLLRREAILSVGGMCEDNIAEDFMTSLFLHERGWKSVYVPQVLAKGLAPVDFLSYYKQQFRWARGSLEILFRFNPIFRRGLTWSQKIQYLASASYYLSGLVVLINLVLPLVFLFTGQSALNITTMTLAGVFLPYILITTYVLSESNQNKYTFRALAFSNSSFPIHLQALRAVLTGQKTSFNVTSKTKLNGNFTYLVSPHLIYIGASVLGLLVAWRREGWSASSFSNLGWIVFNVVTFVPFILAAIPNWGWAKLGWPVALRRSIQQPISYIINLLF